MNHAFDEQLSKQLVGRRVLVTGASGFVGQHLAARLVRLGADVVGLGRSLSRMPEDIRAMAVDLRHVEAVRAAVDSIRPEYVFHLAAFVTARPDRGLIRPMLEHTLMGTVNILEALVNTPCRRVVLISSAEAPLESCVPPNSPYAAAKASTELFASMFHHVYGIPCITLRPTLVYGPGQPNDKLLPYIITSLARGREPSITNPDRICDVLYVHDLVEAICLGAVQPDVTGKTIDIGSGSRIRIRDLAQRVTAMLHKRPWHEGSSRPASRCDLVVDTEAAFRWLSWRAKWSLHEGLHATLNAYTSERREVA